MSKYLTKSKFKLALSCPTKLYYIDRKDYHNNSSENNFLKSLAEGGFQVAQLARLYYPSEHFIETLNSDEAIKQTNILMQLDNVIIHEAAFLYENLFIRIDILHKKGNEIDLIEIKSKSYNEGESLINKKGGIYTAWLEPISDVAFQKYVLSKSLGSGFDINAFLYMPLKNAKTSYDGLNQLFKIKHKDDVSIIENTKQITAQDIGANILKKLNIDEIVDPLISGKMPFKNSTFVSFIKDVSDIYQSEQKNYSTGIGSKCKSCEFKVKGKSDKKCGFIECWSDNAGFTSSDFKEPSILDIWDFRKKDEFISEGKFFQRDIKKEDLETKKNDKEEVDVMYGIDRVDRQWLQIEKSKKLDKKSFINKVGLVAEIKKWKYPLHCIDFETIISALPFNINCSPYEQIAFQYSHHTINDDGTIEHKGEWINTTTGKFPNYDFVRALKNELDKDDGSIFIYSPHENTILNVIYKQLQESDEPDADILCKFIKTITTSTERNEVDKGWCGERKMIDLYDLVKKHYYNPSTNGSNSIKYVLPAILNTSEYLKSKYSKPIYGTTKIKSTNFKNWAWIKFDDTDKIIDPYKSLPTMFDNASEEDIAEWLENDNNFTVNEGGMAMVAYSELQFSHVSDSRKKAITQSLLKYCELDTFAMVLLIEYWFNVLGINKIK